MLVSDMTYQEWLKWKESTKSVANTENSGIIGVKGIGIQFFANRGISKQSDSELRKSIASWNAQIQKHQDKLASPDKYDEGWSEKTDVQRVGLLRHWEKEIKTFCDNVALAESELEGRGNGQ